MLVVLIATEHTLVQYNLIKTRLGTNFSELAAQLRLHGAASLSLLPSHQRLALLKEAKEHTFCKGRSSIGSGDKIVCQGLSYCDNLLKSGSLRRLVREVQSYLEQEFRATISYPFQTPLRLHEPMLQFYSSGSIGITPHLDQASYINLVVIIVLGGGGQFYTCADRKGKNIRNIPAGPGDMILLRCPGFKGAQQRVFHGVSDITEARYSLGIRQNSSLYP